MAFLPPKSISMNNRRSVFQGSTKYESFFIAFFSFLLISLFFEPIVFPSFVLFCFVFICLTAYPSPCHISSEVGAYWGFCMCMCVLFWNWAYMWNVNASNILIIVSLSAYSLAVFNFWCFCYLFVFLSQLHLHCRMSNKTKFILFYWRHGIVSHTEFK